MLLTSIIGIIAGLAGHRTEPIFEYMEKQNTPRTWWMSSRYGTGYLIAMFVFFAAVFRKPWRDEAVSKALLAGVFVGIGTIVGKVLDDLTDGRS